MSVEWVEELPPPRPRRGSSARGYGAQVAGLRERPGTWAILRRYPAPLGPADARAKVARGYAWRLAKAVGDEGFEFVVRWPSDEEVAVYGRYNGEGA